MTSLIADRRPQHFVESPLPAHRLSAIRQLLRAIPGHLFDMDGVLIDSLVAQRRGWARWADRYALDPEPFVAAHGLTARDKIRELAPHLDALSEAAIADAYEAAETDGIFALPGAAQMLSSTELVAVVTSATEALAEVRLAAAGLPRPRVLVTANDVRRGKPDPEPYLLAAQLLGLRPSDCLVFEDAPAGIAAGKAAGMRVVALTTTHDASELTAADLIFADLDDYLGH